MFFTSLMPYDPSVTFFCSGVMTPYEGRCGICWSLMPSMRDIDLMWPMLWWCDFDIRWLQNILCYNRAATEDAVVLSAIWHYQLVVSIVLVVAPCGNDVVPSPGSCYYAMHMFDRHLQVRIDRCNVIPDVSGCDGVLRLPLYFLSRYWTTSKQVTHLHISKLAIWPYLPINLVPHGIIKKLYFCYLGQHAVHNRLVIDLRPSNRANVLIIAGLLLPYL